MPKVESRLAKPCGSGSVQIISVPKCKGHKTRMAHPKLTDTIIDAAILGFEEQRRKLDEQIAELRAMRGHAGVSEKPARRGRRKMSAAGRKAIAEAQRKRWAASRGASDAKASKPAKRPKRK